MRAGEVMYNVIDQGLLTSGTLEPTNRHCRPTVTYRSSEQSCNIIILYTMRLLYIYEQTQSVLQVDKDKLLAVFLYSTVKTRIKYITLNNKGELLILLPSSVLKRVW